MCIASFFTFTLLCFAACSCPFCCAVHQEEALPQRDVDFVLAIHRDMNSFYLLANVHYFGQLGDAVLFPCLHACFTGFLMKYAHNAGGFEAILKRIDSSSTIYLGLNALAHLLHAVFEARDVLRLHFLQNFLPLLAASVARHFAGLDEDHIKPLTRVSIGKIMTYLERLLPWYHHYHCFF